MAKKKQKPTGAEFADTLMQQTLQQVYYRDDFYQFNGRYWERLQPGEVEHEVSDAVVATLGPTEASSPYIKEISEVLRQRLWLSPKFDPPFCRSNKSAENPFIVGNGIVLVDRFVSGRADFLVSHDPDYFVTHGTHYDFDPAATCPQWNEWLQWFTCGDKSIEVFLQNFSGWCLLPNLRLEEFVWLRGGGKNGKSTFAGRLHHVLGGEAAVSSLTISQLRSSGFEIAATVGKRLNIVEEVRKKESIDEATVKRFVSQQAFTLNRKFREAIDARPTARLLVVSNEIPFMADATDALWRRLRVVNCDATIAGLQDIELGKRLDAEASGIFLWLLAGAKRVFEAQQLMAPQKVLQAVSRERLKANPVELFLEETVEVTNQSGDWLPDRVLFENYGLWCEQNRFKGGQSIATFKDVLKRKLKGLTRKRRRWIGDREYGFAGIKKRLEPKEVGEEETKDDTELEPKVVQDLMEW